MNVKAAKALIDSIFSSLRRKKAPTPVDMVGLAALNALGNDGSYRKDDYEHLDQETVNDIKRGYGLVPRIDISAHHCEQCRR